MSDDAGLMHCYFREHVLMGAREAADIRARFAVLAEREGYRLGKIFMEKVESAPEAFGALVAAVVDDRAEAVAVPSLLHLAVLGHPTFVKEELEGVIRGPVLFSDPQP